MKFMYIPQIYKNIGHTGGSLPATYKEHIQAIKVSLVRLLELHIKQGPCIWEYEWYAESVKNRETGGKCLNALETKLKHKMGKKVQD
jgi:hypothetical protein